MKCESKKCSMQKLFLRGYGKGEVAASNGTGGETGYLCGEGILVSKA